MLNPISKFHHISSCFTSIHMTVKLRVYHFHWGHLTFIGYGKNKFGNFAALKKTNPQQKTVCSLLSKENSFGFQMWEFFTCFLLHT